MSRRGRVVCKERERMKELGRRQGWENGKQEGQAADAHNFPTVGTRGNLKE